MTERIDELNEFWKALKHQLKVKPTADGMTDVLTENLISHR